MSSLLLLLLALSSFETHLPLFTAATIMEKIILTLSSGSLRLASTDVRINPIVRFNYFSDPDDLERCVNGTQKIDNVLRSRSMDAFKFQEWLVDRNFRVIGIDALRVVDGSIFTVSPGTRLLF